MGLSCIIPAPALESAITSGKHGLCYWIKVFANYDVVLNVLIAIGVSVLLGFLNRVWTICMYSNPYKNTHIHACMCFCTYLSVYKVKFKSLNDIWYSDSKLAPQTPSSPSSWINCIFFQLLLCFVFLALEK